MEAIKTTIISGMILAFMSTALLGTLFLVHTLLVAVGRSGARLITWLKTWLCTWSGLFWLVNGVCMVFSAQNAGYLFGVYEPLTGWAVGLVLDLLIIVFTQSMLHALARGERSRAAQILSFIFVCTLISFLGNLAHNLHVPSGDAFTGVWFGVLLPSFGLACQHEARTDAPKRVFGEKAKMDPDDMEACMQHYGQRVAEKMPEEAQVWSALDPLCTATLAVVMRLSSVRTAICHGAAFVSALAPVTEYSSAADCFSTLSQVLDNEEAMVLHPALRCGYHICIRGVSDNFQLHTLLADTLIGDPTQGMAPGSTARSSCCRYR